MAHIFKHPSGGQKGIVVFTHKELRFFRGRSIGSLLRPFHYAAHIARIKHNYFVGVHFGGWRVDTAGLSESVDFAMVTEGAAKNLSETRAHAWSWPTIGTAASRSGLPVRLPRPRSKNSSLWR